MSGENGLRWEEELRKAKGAIISPCGRYRYALWRIWSRNLPLLMVIGLNPSTADAMKNDQTITKLTRFAVIWNMGGLLMGNLAAYRSAYPSEILKAADPVGPDCDLWLERMRDRAGMHVAAWGNDGALLPERVVAVRHMFPRLYHLGLTREGYPTHPMARGKYFIPLDRKPELLQEAA